MISLTDAARDTMRWMPVRSNDGNTTDMPDHGIPALFASAAPVGDADALLRCFCLPAGEISILARGLHKPTSKLAYIFQPADELKLQLARGRGGRHVLAGASTGMAHPAWRKDLRLLALYWYMVECACIGSAGVQQNTQVFTLVVNLLRTTPASPEQQHGALAVFCLRLLAGHGLALDLYHCCMDGHLLQDGEPVHLLSSGEGVVGHVAYNARFARSSAGLVHLDGQRLSRWRMLQSAQLMEYGTANADADDAALLLKLCTRLLADLAARPLQSAAFLAQQWRLRDTQLR